ncbi:unnamed protein product [Oikopleura dioica]|uniref:Uncharacterized protein n=1 Tax=Oikopleura dioica TaxID=34765 RepID=E4Z182_OIKDI|nr:unnamed protein product [Oikopleura dioica]
MTIQAIYYCAAFYWICVLLEREKILSRVLDISEDMGFVREMLGVGLAYYSWKLVPPTVSLIVGPKSDRWEKVWIPQDGEEEERAVQNEFEGSVKED